MTRTRKQDRPRVKHLRKKHSLRILQMAAAQRVHPRLLRTSRAAFDLLLAFDPTPNAIYLSSIVRWYLAGRIQIEDGRTVREVLSVFHGLKSRLPIEQRNISTFESPGAVGRALEPIRGARSSMAPADPGILVASGPDWSLHRVDEAPQAKQWARGTSWCTGKLSTAEGYLVSGPLHVLVHAGDRFQMQISSGQFMDVYDEPVLDLKRFPADALHAMQRICFDENRPEWIDEKDPSLPFQRAELHDAASRELARRSGRSIEQPHPHRMACWMHRDTGVFVELVVIDGAGISRADQMLVSHRDRSIDESERRSILGQLATSIARGTSIDANWNCIVVDELMWAAGSNMFQKDMLLISDDELWKPIAIMRASTSEGWPMDPLIVVDIRDERYPERIEIRNRKDFERLDEQLKRGIQKLHKGQEPSMASVVELGLEILDDTEIYEWQKGQSPFRDEQACLLVRNETDLEKALPVLEMLLFCQDHVDEIRNRTDLELSPTIRNWLDERSVHFAEQDRRWSARA